MCDGDLEEKVAKGIGGEELAVFLTSLRNWLRLHIKSLSKVMRNQFTFPPVKKTIELHNFIYFLPCPYFPKAFL